MESIFIEKKKHTTFEKINIIQKNECGKLDGSKAWIIQN